MVFFVATKKPITLWLSLNSRSHLVHFSPGLLALIYVNAFYKLAKQTAHSVYALWALNITLCFMRRRSNVLSACLFNIVLNL